MIKQFIEGPILITLIAPLVDGISSLAYNMSRMQSSDLCEMELIYFDVKAPDFTRDSVLNHYRPSYNPCRCSEVPLYQTLNAALANAKGRYVAIVDLDYDGFQLEYIKALLPLMREPQTHPILRAAWVLDYDKYLDWGESVDYGFEEGDWSVRASAQDTPLEYYLYLLESGHLNRWLTVISRSYYSSHKMQFEYTINKTEYVLPKDFLDLWLAAPLICHTRTSSEKQDLHPLPEYDPAHAAEAAKLSRILPQLADDDLPAVLDIFGRLLARNMFGHTPLEFSLTSTNYFDYFDRFDS